MKEAAGPFHKITIAYQRHRYAILFSSLLISIIAIPVLTTIRVSSRILEVFFAANLLAAIIPIGSSRARRILFLLVLFASFGTQFGTSFFEYRLLRSSMAVWELVGLLAAVSALRFALRASSVDTEHIFAALSAYLLAGIFIGDFYWILEHTWPGSVIVSGEIPGSSFSLASAVYFSFVTLATLGYGDVVPRSDIARGVAVVEAVAGQLYLAVMVARLVSLYVTKNRNRN